MLFSISGTVKFFLCGLKNVLEEEPMNYCMNQLKVWFLHIVFIPFVVKNMLELSAFDASIFERG